MNSVAFTKEQKIKMYARVNEASIPIVFIFLNEDGSDYDISTKNFKLVCKKRANSDDNVFLLEEGNGLTVTGSGTNKLQVQLTDVHASVRPSTYFYRIYSEDEDNTWFAEDFIFHEGKFDHLNNTSETITINDGTVEVTVTISQQGLSQEDLNTRTRSTTSAATLTPNVSLYDMDVITAQAEALTIANPTGTPVNGNGFMIDVTDDGNAQAITYGNKLIGYAIALPSTTIAGKGMKLIFQYSSVTDTYDLLNVINEL